MIKNVGNADRLLRAVIGIVLILMPYITNWAVWDEALWRWLLPIAGIGLLLSAAFRFCGLYRLIGFNSNR